MSQLKAFKGWVPSPSSGLLMSHCTFHQKALRAVPCTFNMQQPSNPELRNTMKSNAFLRHYYLSKGHIPQLHNSSQKQQTPHEDKKRKIAAWFKAAQKLGTTKSLYHLGSVSPLLTEIKISDPFCTPANTELQHGWNFSTEAQDLARDFHSCAETDR